MKDLYDCRYLDRSYSPKNLTSTTSDKVYSDVILYDWTNICLKVDYILTEVNILTLVGGYDS